MEQSWQYSKEQNPAAPVITVNILGFSIVLVLDTGFGGGILIPFTLFQSIGLLEVLSLDSFHAVMPDSRRVTLYTAKTNVTLGTTKVLTEIHASPAIEKRLIGRSFVRSFVTILNGKKQMLTISDSL